MHASTNRQHINVTGFILPNTIVDIWVSLGAQAEAGSTGQNEQHRREQHKLLWCLLLQHQDLQHLKAILSVCLTKCFIVVLTEKRSNCGNCSRSSQHCTSSNDSKASHCKKTMHYEMNRKLTLNSPPGQSFLQVENGGIRKKSGQVSLFGRSSLWHPGPPLSKFGSQVSLARSMS